MANLAYADPFDFGNTPATTDTDSDTVATLQTQDITGGFRATWTGDPKAFYGYKIKIRDWTSGEVKYFYPTYECAIDVINLTDRHCYGIYVYRIDKVDSYTLLYASSFAYFGGTQTALFSYIGTGWDVGVALYNGNSRAVSVNLYADNDKVVIPLDAKAKYVKTMKQAFGKDNMTGGYFVYIEPIPGVTLFRYQTTPAGDYGESAK